MDNALIIDLVLAAVLAVFALLGARKGLIRSLMALVSVVVALIGATLLTAMFVEPVTDLVYPKVEERVLEQFERDIPSDALAAEDGDLSAGGLLPDELSDLLGEALDTLKRFGVSDDAIDGVTKSVTDSAVSAAERAAYLLVKTIVQAALFLAFFLALMLLSVCSRTGSTAFSRCRCSRSSTASAARRSRSWKARCLFFSLYSSRRASA